MTRNIVVESLYQIPVERQEVELVERKGIGHPDSLADGFAEAVSQALCREYQRKCGTILHHNTDQVEVVAGRSKPAFGGGELLRPIYVLLVGRATKEFNDIHIPADSVALRAAREHLEKNMPSINVGEDVIIDCKLGEGSTDLQDVFKRGKAPLANDTSFGIGYAPLTETEKLVYDTERAMINWFKKDIPAIGEDIKVMGLRCRDKITLTIACAMVDRYVDDLSHYFNIKDELRERVLGLAGDITEREVEVAINVADNRENGSVYLTVTGTSAEMGDDGSVGRGNRCNGLITPNRPMSMEATSGKNPVNHVGKIYNLLATEIAHEIAREVPGIQEVYIRLLSQIGRPIDQPIVASAQVIPEDGSDMNLIKREAREIIDQRLADITSITEMLAKGELNTF